MSGFDMSLGNQLQDMLKDLDFMADDITEEVADALVEGAEMIAGEQRRLVPYSKLAGLIKVGNLSTTKKGNIQIPVGYDTDAISAAPEAVIVEFGKPSENRNRKGVETGNAKEIFVARGKDNGYWYKIREKVKARDKSGALLDVKGRVIGFVKQKNHIRKGFDNMSEKAIQHTIEKLDEVIKKW